MARDRTAEIERRNSRVEQRVGYEFKDKRLLQRAMTHRSFAHEVGASEHNEALEFLGDAIIGMLVAERIVKRRPELDEGAMTRLRASLVSTRSLAREAQQLGLGDCLLLGKGEERSGGRSKSSLLADAYEALLAAIFLDSGMRSVRALVGRVFGERIEATGVRDTAQQDAKTMLQEFVQGNGWPLPVYYLIEETGPDHAREFVVEVRVNDECRGRGVGTSKKRAEQAAAQEALRGLID